MPRIDEMKKKAVAEVIRSLHKGMSPERAKAVILRDVGTLTSSEITEIEQSLIDEGVPADEIRRFCNVHALLFESAIEQSVQSPDSPAHPVNMLKRENREIEGIVAAVRAAAGRGDWGSVREGLERLRGVDRHYAIKENALFPFLEKHGFTGPSKVMWAKHNEVREMMKKPSLDTPLSTDERDALLAEIQGMIFKEESILYPAALEKLTAGEWVEIHRACAQIGYPFIADLDMHSDIPETGLGKETVMERTGEITLPSGHFSVDELAAFLDALPVDITFVDAEDTVRYFSQGKDRIFVRATSVIGRKVHNCHPPASVDKVTRILEDFRAGRRDHADFWIHLGGKFVSIRYFAVRDPHGKYLGTLEMTQDLTEIQKLSGERRLLDDAG